MLQEYRYNEETFFYPVKKKLANNKKILCQVLSWLRYYNYYKPFNESFKRKTEIIVQYKASLVITDTKIGTSRDRL